uniref:Coatomer WD associated region domain-containing protein n=2 Tax=Aegilops tauschii subsp. strangulata TaxID=200361 RepID=A0A453CDK6_AEGTS
MKGSRRIVIGYDEGTIMIKNGCEVPVVSMENNGKIIWAKHNEIQTVNIKDVGAGNKDLNGVHGVKLNPAAMSPRSCSGP